MPDQVAYLKKINILRKGALLTRYKTERDNVNLFYKGTTRKGLPSGLAISLT